MKIDLAQEIKEPDGKPIPLEGDSRTTLGRLIYSVCIKAPKKDYAEAKHFIELGEDLVKVAASGETEYEFTTKDQARLQELIQGLPQPLFQVYGAEMLEIKGAES
jgi:hypothetical protein